MAHLSNNDLQEFERRYMASDAVADKSVTNNPVHKQRTLYNQVSNLRQLGETYGADFLSRLPEIIDLILRSRTRNEADATLPVQKTETVKKRYVAIMRFVEVMFGETNDELGWRRFNADLPLQEALDILHTRWNLLRQELIGEEEARLAHLQQTGTVELLKESESRIFVKDWENLQAHHDRYLNETHDIQRLYNDVLDQIQLAQNRSMTANYIRAGPGRLEFMRVVTRVPNDQAERDEMDVQKLNYVYYNVATNGRKTYYIRMNDFKNASSFEKASIRMDAVMTEAYLQLYPLVKAHNHYYLYAPNEKSTPFNCTLRLQQAFEQAIGVPLSVDVLRKMYVYRMMHGQDIDNARAQLISNHMCTDFNTILKYYVFILPEDHVDPPLRINQPLEVRRGTQKKRTDEETEALIQTQGELWDIPGRGKASNPWNLLKQSSRIVLYNGRRKKVSTIFADRSVNSIAAMARSLKKSQEKQIR